jgi:succinyl-CoA synthetase beta subunit
MNLHEYQAHALLREFLVPVLSGELVSEPEEAVRAVRRLGLPAVLKAQVHAGGRGKAGGIRRVSSESEASLAAQAVLNLTINGLRVRNLWVVPAVSIASEAYLSLLVDRRSSELVFVGSAQGGMDIEETAAKSPELILRQALPLSAAADPEALGRYRPLADCLFADPTHGEAVARIMAGMERLLWAKDAALVEINPLVLARAGQVLALDAKIVLDDNALFRQPGNLRLRDEEAESEADGWARAAGLSFVALDGDIGCMVNGAGLAMATMDTLQHCGGSPANFLDVGGSSNPAKVITAFRIILQNPKVRVVFMNIFGGITRCDDIAQGLLAALDRFPVNVPIVVRLTGTNEAQGRALLAAQGERVKTHLVIARTLEEGAEKAVDLGRQA